MLKFLAAAALIASPAAALAETPAATHQIVYAKGKAQHHIRPLSNQRAARYTCHPETSKGMHCMAVARQAKPAKVDAPVMLADLDAPRR